MALMTEGQPSHLEQALAAGWFFGVMLPLIVANSEGAPKDIIPPAVALSIILTLAGIGYTLVKERVQRK